MGSTQNPLYFDIRKPADWAECRLWKRARAIGISEAGVQQQELSYYLRYENKHYIFFFFYLVFRANQLWWSVSQGPRSLQNLKNHGLVCQILQIQSPGGQSSCGDIFTSTSVSNILVARYKEGFWYFCKNRSRNITYRTVVRALGSIAHRDTRGQKWKILKQLPNLQNLTKLHVSVNVALRFQIWNSPLNFVLTKFHNCTSIKC